MQALLGEQLNGQSSDNAVRHVFHLTRIRFNSDIRFAFLAFKSFVCLLGMWEAFDSHGHAHVVLLLCCCFCVCVCVCVCFVVFVWCFVVLFSFV